MGKTLVIKGADFSANGIAGYRAVDRMNYIYATGNTSYIDLFQLPTLSSTNDIKKIVLIGKINKDVIGASGTDVVLGANQNYVTIPVNNGSTVVDRIVVQNKNVTYKLNMNQDVDIYNDFVLSMEDKGMADESSVSINGIHSSNISGSYANLPVTAAFPILGGRMSGSISTKPELLYLKSLKVYGYDDAVLCDLIPTLDDVGKPSMYDRINNMYLYDATDNGGINCV
jgi:hypothetical protein